MDKTAPLLFKPDMTEATRRWDAFYEKDMIDRPVVCVTSPKRGCEGYKNIGTSYREQVEGDIDVLLDNALRDAENTFYGGEAIPAYYPSIGPDEIACYCGAKLEFAPGSKYTNWSVPFVEDWETAPPLALDESSPYWKRVLALYEAAASRFAGKMLAYPLDLHTNFDLLAAVRGSENLCLDLYDTPELVETAIRQARDVFKQMWPLMAKAGGMDTNGYWSGVWGAEGSAMLQCDFSALVSPEMFKKWMLPELVEEAEITKRVVYHWDGPEALRHTDALVDCPYLYNLAYVPLPSEGGHINMLPMLRALQDRGKAVHVSGTPEQIKQMHKTLIPKQTVYNTAAKTQDEAEELLEWFVKNT